MTIGQRIKRIRQHRGMTQKYLGMMMGFPESAADVRIAQYERGSRVPKPAVINRLAAVLGASPVVFSPTVCLSRDDMMQSIFWMEELKGGGDIYDCIKEWEAMKTKYDAGEISAEEYFEWKLTYTSSPSGLPE